MSIESVKEIKVIKTTFITGTGTKENPVRVITQYWDLKGKLLATVDDYELSKSSASSDTSS